MQPADCHIYFKTHTQKFRHVTGTRTFQKFGCHLEILGARRSTCSKLHTLAPTNIRRHGKNSVARDWRTPTFHHYIHRFLENLIHSRCPPPQVRNLQYLPNASLPVNVPVQWHCCALSHNSNEHTWRFNQCNLKIFDATKFFMRLHSKRLLPNCSIRRMKVIIDHSWILHAYQLGIMFTRVTCLCNSTAYTTLHYTTLH